MTQYHKILQQQIKKHLGDSYNVSPEMEKLLQIVSETYGQYEKERESLEKSMDLRSEELFASNEKLRKEAASHEILLDELRVAIKALQLEADEIISEETDDQDLLSMVEVLQEKIRMTKDFEEKLRVSGLKFQAIVENTEDIIWSVDEYFRLSIFNSFYRQQTIKAYNIDPVLGDRLSNIIPPVEYLELEEKLNRAVQGERFIIEEKKTNGQSVNYYETSFNPIKTEGKITGISVFTRNITNRKQDEKRKNDLLKELQHVNEELGQIAYITSHDLKTPLRSIGSIVSWIKSDYGHLFDENTNKQINILINRVTRLYNLIDAISMYMSVANTEENRQMVDLNQVLRHLLDTIPIPDHIKVEVKKPFPKVLAVKWHMHLIFEHLIKNAITFMDKEEGLVALDFSQNDDVLDFTVTDNGPGIDERHYEKIFKLFQTLKTKDELETNGMGLSITKKVIEQYEGDLKVESCPGKGATFHCQLIF